MEKKRSFWVLGGDLRQAHLAQLLTRDGHVVCTYALEQGAHAAPTTLPQSTLMGIGRADCVILPLPVCSTPGTLSTPLSRVEHALAPVLESLSPGQLICGGRVDPDTLSQFARHGLTIHDYFVREELTVANAVPTAEGAIQIAMEELPITIHGARVLVIGFGRVGKATAQRFAALGAKVTVAARSWEQLAWAHAMGLNPQHMQQLSSLLSRCDLVVNTVPAPILGQEELTVLHPDVPILDLASKPGGIDMDAAAGLGRRVIWALALPGKVAPLTTGAYIRDTVYNILREAGI